MENKSSHKPSHSDLRNVYVTCAVQLLTKHPMVPMSISTRQEMEEWMKGEMAKLLKDAETFATNEIAKQNSK